MSFVSGSVSFQRLAIRGAFPQEVDDRFVARLTARSFGRSAAAGDETQTGWIGPRHVLDTQVLAETITVGQFVQVAMRVDRLSVPANVLRAYAALEEAAALEASGRAQLSRTEQRRARQAAQDRAAKEVRAGTYRRMTAYPVLIDLAQRTVYLGTLGAAAADRLMVLFSETFGARLEPLNAERVATTVLDRAQRVRQLEQLAPFTLVRPPAEAEVAGSGTSTDMGFLGKEFLTWLWYRTEAEENSLRVISGDDVTVMLDRVLRLQCDFGMTGSDVITADGPTSLPEARAALASGKQPLKAGLVLGSPRGEFRLTLDGPRLAVSGLVLPEGSAGAEPAARLEARLEAVADAAGLLDALFEMYLLERTSKGWEAELGRMRTWATGKRGARRRVVAG